MTLAEIRARHVAEIISEPHDCDHTDCRVCGVRWPCDTVQVLDHYATLEAAVGRFPKVEGKVMISPFRNDVVVLEFAGGMPELADCYTKELADALADLLRLRQEAP